MGCDLGVESIGGEAHPRAGMFQDVVKLSPVQLGVRRHSGEAAMPDPENRLDIFDAVLGGDRDAIAGLQS